MCVRVRVCVCAFLRACVCVCVVLGVADGGCGVAVVVDVFCTYLFHDIVRTFCECGLFSFARIVNGLHWA